MKRILYIIILSIIICCLFNITYASEKYEYGIYKYTLREDGTAMIVYCDDDKYTTLKVPETMNGIIVTGIDVNFHVNKLYLPKDINYINTERTQFVEEIIIDENNNYFCSIDGVLFSKDQKTLIKYPINNKQKTYNISDQIEKIEDKAFHNSSIYYGYPNLLSINVSENNKNYYSINGVLFEKETNTLIYYPQAITKTEYTIPDGTKKIGRSAISNTYLKSIKMSNDVEEIEEDGFIYCKSLTNIILSNNLKYIKDCAFCNCTSLTSINLPDSLISIEGVPFKYCSSLVRVNIGENLNYIETNPFIGCTILEKITISKENKCFATINDVLFNKNEKLLIVYPLGIHNTTYSIPDGIKIIGNKAFMNNKILKTIKIPETVEEIRDNAFWDCEKLENIILPSNLSKIGIEIFGSCEKLSGINLPKNINTITYGMFCYCESLITVTSESPIIKIEDNAFKGCKCFTLIHLEEVKELGENIFGIYGSNYYGYSDWLTIVVGDNEYAKQYCIENNIPCIHTTEDKYNILDNVDWLN